MTINFFKLSWLTCLFFVLSNCAGEPVADSPGVCSIQCSEAKLAGSRSSFRMRLATEDFSFFCGSGMFADGQDVALFPYPIPVRFIVESNSDEVPYTSPFGGEETAGSGDAGSSTVESGWAPVGNVSFDVVTSGGTLNPCGTNAENGTVNSACNSETGGLASGSNFRDASVTPHTHAGIVTPKSEWCSDSCGIMSIDIWPVCVRGGLNRVSLSVRSGGIFSNTVQIDISNSSTASLNNSLTEDQGIEEPENLFDAQLYLRSEESEYYYE